MFNPAATQSDGSTDDAVKEIAIRAIGAINQSRAEAEKLVSRAARRVGRLELRLARERAALANSRRWLAFIERTAEDATRDLAAFNAN